MEIFTLIFMFILPIAFFIYANRFRGIMALILIAPVAMINVLAISLNTGFDQDNPPALEYTFTPCELGRVNATAQIIANVTYANYTNTVVCSDIPVTQSYIIGFQNMQIFNGLIGIFTLLMLFVVWRRITTEQTTPSDK